MTRAQERLARVDAKHDEATVTKPPKRVDVAALMKENEDEARAADRASVEAKHDEATVTIPKKKKKGPKMQDLARAGGGQSTVAPGPKVKINK